MIILLRAVVQYDNTTMRARLLCSVCTSVHRALQMNSTPQCGVKNRRYDDLVVAKSYNIQDTSLW